MSTNGTTDSSSPGISAQPLQYNLTQQFGASNGLPDLSAMMFPSADPFAYPNQPMMEYDNIKQENIDNLLNSSQAPSFLSNETTAPGIYDDLEGQLFGPIPPYLMQGQPNFDGSGQMDTGGIPGMNLEMNYGVPPNGDMNFDSIFLGDGGDEWMADQRFRH